MASKIKRTTSNAARRRKRPARPIIAAPLAPAAQSVRAQIADLAAFAEIVAKGHQAAERHHADRIKRRIMATKTKSRARASVSKTAKQIVVLDRGFVYVGDVSITKDFVVIKNAKNIRYWGTSKGLGELVNGPLSGTKVDEVGTVHAPLRAVISLIDVGGTW